ncbi:hypothetical protein EUV02_06790 [Polymorphobacter arshaanensis]|uniref:Uncharacterized protein n=1 Tax=Glacieibacterium arshaanense TaxID=2511025 RepID=A0A4Y9EM81_9SPHN|nr:hypothetical protein [Polymorphobacter arshaanensis]TFU02911.1 hypothetical protein EUV02_06790 [Polymorphobacter arshaanensis]
MANKQDPLIESLMALAVSAAPLIQRARDSGLFKPGSREAEASEIVITPDPAPAAPAAPTPDFAAEKAALQDIVVQQAMRINALEAEVAALKAARKAKKPA